MPTRPRSKSASASPETVVFSARLRPETESALRAVAKETGLAYDALLHRAALLLRADPVLRKLAARVRETDALLAELRTPLPPARD
jgi:hypothetical protein